MFLEETKLFWKCYRIVVRLVKRIVQVYWKCLGAVYSYMTILYEEYVWVKFGGVRYELLGEERGDVEYP